MTNASDIVRSARALVGVPYRDEGRTVRGLDCAGCVLLVAAKHKLRKIVAPTNYRRANTESYVLDQMRRNFDAFKPVTAKPGMVVVVRPRHSATHLAILDTMRTMIEACNLPNVMRVVRRDIPWDDVRGVFAFKGVDY